MQLTPKPVPCRVTYLFLNFNSPTIYIGDALVYVWGSGICLRVSVLYEGDGFLGRDSDLDPGEFNGLSIAS